MTLVYQAYGLEEVMRQTIFSVGSLLFHLQGQTIPKVVIYTDRPDVFLRFFKGEPRVQLEQVSMAQIKKWRGAIDFVHRVKIEILIDAGKKYQGPLFYADGDTYFISSPNQLFSEVNDSVSIMHIAESALNRGKDPISKKMKKFVSKNSFVINGETIRLPIDTVMWNAGVIGISENNKGVLGKILQLTDEMHSRYPKHVTEQLAVSYFLQTRTKVIPANKVVYHYWNQKSEYQKLIDEHLGRIAGEGGLIEAFASVRFPPPPPPKKGFVGKLIGRILAKNESA